jgi:Ca-activated chloride channel family protein
MHLPTRYATKITAASVSLFVAFAFSFSVSSQEQAQDKPAAPAPSQTQSQTPAQTPEQNKEAPKQKMGTDLDDRSLITNTDLITLTVTVTDTYGRYVSGLSKSAFAVYDNKQQQEITFFSDDDSPVSVGVIFDVSGSMSGDKVKRARDALSKFIQTSHDADEYFLIAFNSRAQLLLDRTRDGDSILNKLTFVETKSQTALYDACYLGVEKVQRGAHPKRALLLISDGQDNDSRYTFNELRKLLKESDVTLYAIGILSGSDAGSALGMEGQGVLDELSGVSGGMAFFPRSAA